MAEFEINGHKYVSEKMSPFAALHVGRRLSPVITSIKDILISPGDFAPGALGGSDNAEDVNFKVGMAVLDKSGPLLEAVAKMPDEQVNYILETCLSVCKRQSGVGWQNVWDKASKSIGFDDIDMIEMLTIVRYVITENMSGFFTTSPSS
jgi:hypothetical protein